MSEIRGKYAGVNIPPPETISIEAIVKALGNLQLALIRAECALSAALAREAEVTAEAAGLRERVGQLEAALVELGAKRVGEDLSERTWNPPPE